MLSTILTMKKIFSVMLVLASATAMAQTFSTPLKTDRKPWTGIPTFAGNDYKFVVLPDKTGGDETGAFELAIEEINRLAPDFVINVGDLIGGYFTDVKYCERDWKDILGRLEKLEAPFFFVGGNHDMTNQLQTDDFIRRFGANYYSFNVGPDLFLVLDTQEHGGRDISDAQVEYFRGVLDGWDGRHIYVFMHAPLWAPQNHGGYEHIDELLQGHRYTVFSGHTHQYYYEQRGGMDYFVVATAGGDSELRGPLFGEYDHIMLVSARDGKPAIANLPIGSLVPNDIVDKNTMPLIHWMTSGSYVKAPYLVLDSTAPEEFGIELSVSNPFDAEMEFGVDFKSGKGLDFSTPHIAGKMAPRSDKKYTVKVKNPDGVEPGKIVAGIFARYEIKGVPQEANGTLAVLTDCVRNLAKGEKMTLESRDHYDIDESWDWHGLQDGWFDFDVEYTGRNIVITVRTHDDIRALDKVEIFLESGGKKYAVSCEPETAVLTVPVRKIKNGSFTLNVKFTDNDDPEEGDPSVLWWRLPSAPGQFRISPGDSHPQRGLSL